MCIPPTYPAHLPIIHSNGSGRDRIVDGFQSQIDALHNALDAMSEATPNGRDYYPRNGSIRLAETVHQARMDRIRAIITDLTNDAIAVINSCA